MFTSPPAQSIAACPISEKSCVACRHELAAWWQAYSRAVLLLKSINWCRCNLEFWFL